MNKFFVFVGIWATAGAFAFGPPRAGEVFAIAAVTTLLLALMFEL